MAKKERYEIVVAERGGPTRRIRSCQLEEPPNVGEVLLVSTRQRRYVDICVESVHNSTIRTRQVAGAAAFFTALERFGYAALECRREGIDIEEDVAVAADRFKAVFRKGPKNGDCVFTDRLTSRLKKRLTERRTQCKT